MRGEQALLCVMRVRAGQGRTKRGGERELDALAHALGIDGTGFTRLDAVLDGARVIVQLEFVERRDLDEVDLDVRSYRRVAHALELIVMFEGSERVQRRSDAPSIQLRRETQADRADKRSGLVKEVQTGFERFDHAVFVDNESSEADAKRILSKEATRQAVLRLLEAGHEAVNISTTSVSVRHVLEPDEVDFVHVQPVLDALDDLRVVSRAGGPKDVRPPRKGENSLAVLIALGVLAITYALGTSAHFETGFLPLLIGLVVGGIVAFFSRPFLADDVAGDSGSGRRSGQLTLAAFCTAAGLVTGGLVHLDVLFDSSEPQVDTGVVTRVHEEEVRRDGGGASRRRRRTEVVQFITVRDAHGGIEDLEWSGDARVGDRYVVTRRAGAFGFAWVQSRELVRR